MEEVKDLVSVFFSINFTDSHDCCMFTSSFEALKASRVYSNYSSCAGDFSHPLFTLAQPHFLPTAAAHFIDFREYAPENPHMTHFPPGEPSFGQFQKSTICSGQFLSN